MVAYCSLIRRHAALAFCALLALAGAYVPPAAAHPHVWVTVKTTVLYDNGKIIGFRHKWTFDEFYTAMAIEGLDTNKDGIYSREELAELAQVNIDGLKEFAYFTYPKLGKKELAVDAPKDYWLDYEDAPPQPADATPPAPAAAAPATPGAPASNPPAADAKSDGPVKVLSLNFTLPLKQPILADAQGFTFSVYDPSFFIAFDLEGADAVKLGPGAPPACRVEQEAETPEAKDAQKLGQAFSSEFGGRIPGFSGARPIKVVCTPKS